MGYYRVQIHGTGIRIAGEEKSRPIIGFYTTRIVRANYEDDARAKAIASVRDQWASGAEAKYYNCGSPTLHVEEVVPARFLQGLLFRNTGHTFYLEDEHAI
jgi:hypothetical protein